MGKTIRKIKIVVDPFKVPIGHSDWKRRKMGVMSSKGFKVSRSERNRVTRDDVP